MKVIVDNYTRNYRLTCKSCASILELSIKEIQDATYESSSSRFSVDCPVCGTGDDYYKYDLTEVEDEQKLED